MTSEQWKCILNYLLFSMREMQINCCEMLDYASENSIFKKYWKKSVLLRCGEKETLYPLLVGLISALNVEPEWGIYFILLKSGWPTPGSRKNLLMVLCSWITLGRFLVIIRMSNPFAIPKENALTTCSAISSSTGT